MRQGYWSEKTGIVVVDVKSVGDLDLTMSTLNENVTGVIVLARKRPPNSTEHNSVATSLYVTLLVFQSRASHTRYHRCARNCAFIDWTSEKHKSTRHADLKTEQALDCLECLNAERWSCTNTLEHPPGRIELPDPDQSEQTVTSTTIDVSETRVMSQILTSRQAEEL